MLESQQQLLTTLQGWAARGIIIPGISMANPWPGEQRFAAVSTL